MRIEINPRSLKNLKEICEVLYKLHPYVLDKLIDMERRLGKVLGRVDLNNLSLEEREYLTSRRVIKPDDESDDEPMEDDNYSNHEYICFYEEGEGKRREIEEMNELSITTDTTKLLEKIQELLEDKNAREFDNLKRNLKLDTYEYIPIKINIEVEDPVIGRKVKELVEALEKTRAPEQFYFNKIEMYEDAYFAEGYGVKMNEEQKEQLDNFLVEKDVEGLERLLKKEKLYP